MRFVQQREICTTACRSRISSLTRSRKCILEIRLEKLKLLPDWKWFVKFYEGTEREK